MESEKGEIVIAFVRFLCEIVNRYGVNTIRWGVRIFAVVQNTSQTVKPISDYFDAEYVRCRENRKISLYAQEIDAFTRYISESLLKFSHLCATMCVHTYTFFQERRKRL